MGTARNWFFLNNFTCTFPLARSDEGRSQVARLKHKQHTWNLGVSFGSGLEITAQAHSQFIVAHCMVLLERKEGNKKVTNIIEMCSLGPGSKGIGSNSG